MTEPNADNPARVRDCDLTFFATLPEWHRLTEALDAVITAVLRRGVPVAHDDWLEALRDHAAALPYADQCQACCRARIRQSEPLPSPVAPAMVRIEGNGLDATYRCAAGHVWRCGWAVDIVKWLP